MFDVHFVTQFRLPAIQWFMWKHLQQPLGGFGLRWHAQYCVVEAQRCYVSSVSRAHKLSVSRLCLKPPPSSQRATAAREQFESAIMRSRGEYGKAGLCVYSWQQNRRYIYAFRHRVCCSSRYRLQARAEAICNVARRCYVWTRCFLSALFSPSTFVTAHFSINQAFVIRYGNRNEFNDSRSDFNSFAVPLVAYSRRRH